MSDIAVIHMDLMAKGGGEAVCMNVLEAFQREHDVTLITLGEADIRALNDYFNTDVDADALDVRRAGRLTPWLHDTVGIRYYVLQNALLGRYARRHADDYDLLVSTINELGLGSKSVQYIHFPFDWTVSLDNRDHIFHPTIEENSSYERLCTAVAGIDLAEIRSNTLLANSEWTADVVEDAYGTRPQVVHPPIDTAEFDARPWDEREDGFVTVGRIERSKRLAEIIEIVDEIRERGTDVHLHILGPTVDEEYRREIEAMTTRREYVALEGEVTREELVKRICSHKYGIHGKQFEHFGMAVAELVAGGAVTFVPETGGQHAIVRDEERLLYESPADAVEKIDAVISDADSATELRMTTAEVERRFGRDRFRGQIRAVVDEALDRPTRRIPDAEAERSASTTGVHHAE